MVWCEISTIRDITGVSSDAYDDGDITNFISLAQREVNSKVIQKVIREKIEQLDSTRTNKIDGSNTTYYLKNWKGNYLGDTDYDFSVDTTDVEVYQVASDGTETELTVSSVDYEKMSFTLSAAPSNASLYVTYSYTPYNPVSPDPFLQQVTTYLAASYIDLTDGADESIRFGNVSIMGSGSNGIKGNKYYQKYMELMNQLQESVTNGALWGESFVRI